MLLTLVRFPPTPTAIIGTLAVNGVFECWTLENALLAVSCGSYKIELYNSPAHGPDTPQLVEVPGRSNIQIHVANFPHELKGCIAPGQAHGSDYVEHSKAACDALLPKIRTAIKSGELVQLVISADLATHQAPDQAMSV